MERTADAVYCDLEEHGVVVFEYPMKKGPCISSQDGFLAIDSRDLTSTEEYTALIHERGHFKSGAFYTPYSPYQIKAQAEYRADRSAILDSIPYSEMAMQLNSGLELWELAEHFGVTEDYCLKAYLFYKDRYGKIA